MASRPSLDTIFESMTDAKVVKSVSRKDGMPISNTSLYVFSFTVSLIVFITDP